jgi:hypothetical protein
MTSEEYRNYLINRLIREFQDRFYDKVGLLPVVSVPLENVKKLSMVEVERIINQEIPENMLPDFPNIRAKTRRREIVYLRQIFVYILHKEFRYGPTALGFYLGQDHTTMIHSIRTAEHMITADEDYKNTYHSVLSKVKYHGTNPIQQTPGSGDNPEPVYSSVASEEQLSLQFDTEPEW